MAGSCQKWGGGLNDDIKRYFDDMAAAWEEIFPSTFIYMTIAVVAFHVWEAFGGNKPYNNNRYNTEVEK